MNGFGWLPGTSTLEWMDGPGYCHLAAQGTGLQE